MNNTATNINMNGKKQDTLIDETFNNLAGNFVKILNEAVEKEELKTEYWKHKAFILANKKGLCIQHEAKEAENNFNNLGKSFEYYIENGVECADYNYKELKK